VTKLTLVSATQSYDNRTPKRAPKQDRNSVWFPATVDEGGFSRIGNRGFKITPSLTRMQARGGVGRGVFDL